MISFLLFYERLNLHRSTCMFTHCHCCIHSPLLHKEGPKVQPSSDDTSIKKLKKTHRWITDYRHHHHLLTVRMHHLFFNTQTNSATFKPKHCKCPSKQSPLCQQDHLHAEQLTLHNKHSQQHSNQD